MTELEHLVTYCMIEQKQLVTSNAWQPTERAQLVAKKGLHLTQWVQLVTKEDLGQGQVVSIESRRRAETGDSWWLGKRCRTDHK